MSDQKKIPIPTFEAESLDDFLNSTQIKVMTESVERTFKTLRSKAERARRVAKKDANEQNTKKFLHAAQDFFYFGQLLQLLEGQTAQIMVLTQLVNDLTERLEGDLGIPMPPIPEPEPTN